MYVSSTSLLTDNLIMHVFRLEYIKPLTLDVSHDYYVRMEKKLNNWCNFNTF